ncbi:hypothetical protein JR338_05725 [Chloroflexota bacterium]|nr:hypothetical protein JR338_05725 [Chloroflexota bacterium]
MTINSANEIIESGRSAYMIQVKDHLDTSWTHYFEGWSVRNLENGEVLLTIPTIDQAGLHGVLNKIRDLNLIIITVKRLAEL